MTLKNVLIRSCFGALLLIGVMAILLGTSPGRALRNMTAADVILTPAEISDPAKVDIVYRSLKHAADPTPDRRLWVFSGIATAGLSLAGWLLFESRIKTRASVPVPNLPGVTL